MKKKFLELLLRTYGLHPREVKHWRTDSCGGTYQVSTGWQGKGVLLDIVGQKETVVINFKEQSFNYAVKSIIDQASNRMLYRVNVSDSEEQVF